MNDEDNERYGELVSELFGLLDTILEETGASPDDLGAEFRAWRRGKPTIVTDE